jgi:uncharacterized membrane protein
MTWALPYLYLQLILHARSSIEVAGVAPGTLLTFLVVCIVLFLISVAAHRLTLSHRTEQGVTRA